MRVYLPFILNIYINKVSNLNSKWVEKAVTKERMNFHRKMAENC